MVGQRLLLVYLSALASRPVAALRLCGANWRSSRDNLLSPELHMDVVQIVWVSLVALERPIRTLPDGSEARRAQLLAHPSRKAADRCGHQVAAAAAL